MSRRFNTAGPCDPAHHYTVPPESRLPAARTLVEQGDYFVLHAPRQTGKTTLLRALARSLNAAGDVAAVAFSCEAGEPFGDRIGDVEEIVLSELRLSAGIFLPEELQPPPAWPDAPEGQRLRTALVAWSRAAGRPLALFFDEIDALRGESLRAILRQLRAGFADRPHAFPQSVVLCGLRDVRDYKAASGGDPELMGTSSPFNIKVESLRLGTFTRDEVRVLLAQHTEDTGQSFAPGAEDYLCELSGGQPWLVNALAREVVEKIGVEADSAITRAHLQDACGRLVLARQTHLDSLVARLHEPRVRRVLEPLLAGDVKTPEGSSWDDDVGFARDLGLVAPTEPLRMANPIYKEVIARVLSAPVESRVTVEPRSFVREDGALDIRRVLDEFAAFWREHGDVLTPGVGYHEVAPQLVLMAWLQRIVNGGGWIDREYGVGRGRIDLLVRWPYRGPDGRRALQRAALELKVWRDGRPDPLARGLVQLDGYLERLGLDDGVLVLFDRRAAAAAICERTRFEAATTTSGRRVTLLRA